MQEAWLYIITTVVGSLATIVTARLTGFSLQKVQVKGEEVKNSGMELQNAKEYFEATRLIIEDMKEQISTLVQTRAKERLEKDEHIGRLEQKIEQLTKSNRELVKKVSNLEQSICNECPKRQKQ